MQWTISQSGNGMWCVSCGAMAFHTYDEGHARWLVAHLNSTTSVVI